MFGSLGVPELLLIFIVALLVFGPKRLPDIGKTLGKALGEFKRATEDLKTSIEREVQVEEQKQLSAQVSPTPQVVPRDEAVTAIPVEPTAPAKTEP
jgi:TatA/E family protein of Tat protein translocase